jgi:hypothetical protein
LLTHAAYGGKELSIMINYLIGGLILLAVIIAVAKIRKDKKDGNCCGGCSGCASEGHCSAYDSFESSAKEKLRQE